MSERLLRIETSLDDLRLVRNFYHLRFLHLQNKIVVMHETFMRRQDLTDLSIFQIAMIDLNASDPIPFSLRMEWIFDPIEKIVGQAEVLLVQYKAIELRSIDDAVLKTYVLDVHIVEPQNIMHGIFEFPWQIISVLLNPRICAKNIRYRTFSIPSLKQRALICHQINFYKSERLAANYVALPDQNMLGIRWKECKPMRDEEVSDFMGVNDVSIFSTEHYLLVSVLMSDKVPVVWRHTILVDDKHLLSQCCCDDLEIEKENQHC